MVVGLVILVGLAIVVGLIIAGVLGIVLFLVMSSNDHDVVSGARQGWIQRRSEKDTEGW